MEEGDDLIVFSPQSVSFPLNKILTVLVDAGIPASMSVSAAGEADEADLLSREWDAVFIRWTEPELHDVLLLTRDNTDVDEDAAAILNAALDLTKAFEGADRLLVEDHLRRTHSLYSVEFLPALLADEEHPAWDALDLLLAAIADASEGMVYAKGEGFFDDVLNPILAFESEDDEFPEETE